MRNFTRLVKRFLIGNSYSTKVITDENIQKRVNEIKNSNGNLGTMIMIKAYNNTFR